MQLDIESTLELDYEGANTPMGPSDPLFKLIYLVGMGCEGWIDSSFNFVHTDVLVIMQGCIGVSK